MSARATVASRVGGLLLNLAALGGLVCIVLVILAQVWNISLIMFKTGSMSPTIPAGSLALVRQIPASDFKIGDVLTVDRPGQLPVTHRVISIDDDATAGGTTRTFRMQGDANDTPDPAPYTVEHARIVLASVPGLARVVVWFSNAWVLGGITLAASVLVTWAFWPRTPKPYRENATPRRVRARRHAAGHAVAVVIVGITLGAASAAGGFTLHEVAPASAVQPERDAALREADAPVIVRGQRITLTSIGDTAQMRSMEPGIPVHWQVGVRVNPAERADQSEIVVSAAAMGSDELGLIADVRECGVRWQGNVCAEREVMVAEKHTVRVDGSAGKLAVLEPGDERWFLVTAEIPTLANGEVEFRIIAASDTGSETVTPGPIGSGPGSVSGPFAGLSETGALPAWKLALAAVTTGLVVAGIAAITRWRGARLASEMKS